LSEAYITDPYFYALAVPAVVLLGLSKSGFGAGFGSLAVPIMAMAITVPQAAAILMPILLVMDLLGLHAFRREYDVKLLKFLIPWAWWALVWDFCSSGTWSPAGWPAWSA
jgi:hypothetical protein